MVIIVVVLGVVTALIVAGFVLAGLFVSQAVNSTQITVTGAEWTIEYEGSTSGYFGPTSQSSCSSCPQTLFLGETFTDTLTLVNSATGSSHTITTITVSAPFMLVSEYPATPYSLAPGAAITLTLTVRAPSTSGSFVLDGYLATT